jgi:tRNA threonylcarbamoyl adenosine modification protein YeaZ
MDTATAAVTVALGELALPPTEAGAATILAETATIDARRHGELLAPGIDEVLRATGHTPADVGAVVVGVGPGPFTGLRVGLVTARTLGLALGIPVYGVCTLDALAYDADLTGDNVVATDARRREVYWARYRDAERVDGPHVDKPVDLAWSGPTVGAGAALYPDVLGEPHPPEYVRAGALLTHAAAGRLVLPVQPLYLRRPDAAEPGPRKPVLT